MEANQEIAVFLLGNGVTHNSIAFGWSISGDLPKSIKVFRTYPTEQLLLDLTPEQFATVTTWEDTGLSPQTFHSYLVSCEYEDKKTSIPLDMRTLGVTAWGLSVIPVNCYTNLFSWNGDGGDVFRDDNNGWDRLNPAPRPWWFFNVTFVCGRGDTSWTDCSVYGSMAYTYHAGGNQTGFGPTNNFCVNSAASGYAALRLNAVTNGNTPILNPDAGTDEILVPQGSTIGHYSRISGENDWKYLDTLVLPQGYLATDTALSLSQNFIHPEMLDAIVEVTPAPGNTALIAYEFISGMGQATPFTLVTESGPIETATGSPALIRSDQGRFEVFVPSDSVIQHFSFQQDSLHGAQGKLVNVVRFLPVITKVAAAAVTQSTSGELAVVTRVTSSLITNGDVLFAFKLDPLFIHDSFVPIVPLPVLADGALIDAVTGNPTFLYSTQLKAFQLVVPRQRDGRVGLDYYVLEGETIANGGWKYVSTLPDAGAPPVAVSLVRSFTPGQLEAFVRVSPPNGSDYLLRYTLVSPQQLQPWTPPSVITSGGQPIIVGSSAPPAPTLISLTLSPTTIQEGGASQGTVTLSGLAPTGGELISLVSNNPNLVTVPASVTVADGQTAASFNVGTTSPTAIGSAVISATLAGVTQTATLTVAAAPPPPIP